jgi:simple sugar transport system permease protein
MDLLLDPRLWQLTVATAAPLLLAALGELMAERAGVLNVSIEGLMALGASVGFLAAFLGHDPGLGVIAAVVAGALVVQVLAYAAIRLRIDQLSAGLALFVLCVGLASLGYRLAIGFRLVLPRVATLAPWPVPHLGTLPVAGKIIFTQNPLVYLALFLAPAAWAILFHTPLGLRIRSVGENPRAADAVGINVFVLRWTCLTAAGSLAGLAGAYYPLAITGAYHDGIIGGRGWIALMLVILGRWSPWLTVGGAMLFAYVEVLQFKVALFVKSLPPQFLLMVPYLLAIVVLAGAYRGARGPAALMRPYDREERG